MCIKIHEYGGDIIASYFQDLKIVLNSSSMGLRALRALTGFTGPAYGTLTGYGLYGPTGLTGRLRDYGPYGP